MAFADLLLTRPPMLSGLMNSDARHRLFDGLVRRGALVTCPPRSERAAVTDVDDGAPSYGWDAGGGRELVGPMSPFAVTRWSNVWFPVTRGTLRGDWFGGALGPLFGPGVRDVAVDGTAPARHARGAAHTAYFTHADQNEPGDVAWHLRAILGLDCDVVPAAPPTDPGTVERVVHRSWQRSS